MLFLQNNIVLLSFTLDSFSASFLVHGSMIKAELTYKLDQE
jgi:hypothetical protein